MRTLQPAWGLAAEAASASIYNVYNTVFHTKCKDLLKLQQAYQKLIWGKVVQWHPKDMTGNPMFSPSSLGHSRRKLNGSALDLPIGALLGGILQAQESARA